MREPRWPEAVERAFVDANPHSYYTDDDLEIVYHRWHDFQPEAMIQVLEQGDEADRVFAIFLLGYLAPTDITSRLWPFLQSPPA
ncbi:MAG TPA: hypothetical protein VFA09_19440 [Ktedonobacteraceae bacterium]|jgi:hypothetical protein|nr:hypothetical protein [Ktedonobacteraceae bacterium]